MKSLSLTLLTLFSGIILAQEANDIDKVSFSLEEAMKYGLENNLNLKNSQLEYEEAKKKVSEVTASGLPQIDASGNVNHYIKVPTQVIPARAFNPQAGPNDFAAVQFGITNSATFGLSGSQMIFDGTFFVGLQAAKSYKELREKAVIKTEIDVRDQVSRAYYNVLIAIENEKIFKQNIDKLEDQFNTIKKMNEQGMVEDLEVDQLDLILSDAKKRYETTKRQVEVSYQMLNFAMGREIAAPMSLTDSLLSIYKSYDEGQLLTKDLTIENHIDYQLISAQERMQELSIKADRSTWLPNIKASGYYGHNSFSNQYDFNNWYQNSYVALNVNMPIFSSFETTHKIQQDKIQLDRIRNNRMLLEDNLQLQVNTARTVYIDALEQFTTERKNLDLSRKIFETTRTKQTNGMASSLDVTIANNQFLETQGRYIGALYKILDAKASLDKSLNNY